MSDKPMHNRRRFLRLAGAGGVAALAGCSGQTDGGGSGDTTTAQEGTTTGDSGGGGSDLPSELRFIGFGGNTQKTQMNVFNKWGEENGVTISGTPAGGTTEMISLIKQNPSAYDVIALNDTGMARAQQEDVLEPLDLSKVPNFEKNIREAARGLPFQVNDAGETMGMIRESGATGFAYNTDKVDDDLTSWHDLKKEAYAGKVSLIDRTIDRLSNNAIAIGLDINTVPGDAAKKDKMFADAKEMDKNVFAYWSNGATSIRYLRQENAWICEAWGGRVLALQEEGYDNIKYVVPEEGAMAWADNLAVVKGTEHKDAVHQLLNFTYQRENLLDIAKGMNYTVQVPNPPDWMKAFPDYAPASNLAFRDWSTLLPKQEAWTQRLDSIKAE